MAKNGLVGGFFNRESGSAGMTDHADHPDRVLLKSLLWIANGPYHPLFKISHPSDIVDDRKIGDVVKKAIDRDVSSKRIFLWSSKTVRQNDASILRLNLLEFRPASKGGDLHNLSPFKEDMDESESAADDPAVPEERVNLIRMGIGDNIKILRSSPQEKVTDTSSNKVR